MRCTAPIVMLFLASVAHAGEVAVVDGSGSRFETVQEAVDAAPEGALLLVGEGTYAGFEVQAKSLSIAALPGAGVLVEGRVRVRDLGPHQVVVLDGLTSLGATVPGVSEQGALFDQNQGAVRAYGCTFVGGDGYLDGSHENAGRGGDGVQMNLSRNVVLTACAIEGGMGAPTFVTGVTEGRDGGVGVRVVDSTLALYDCTVVGGEGGIASEVGGDGGEGGIAAGASWLFAAGTSFQGGDGGTAWDTFGLDPGAGGDGLLVRALARAWLRDASTLGGEGGAGANTVGPDGQDLVALGVVKVLGPSARTASTASVRSDGGSVSYQITGQPGDEVWLAVAAAPGFRFQRRLAGVWALPYPSPIGVVPLGVVPGSGVLDVTVPAGDLPDGSVSRELFLQGYARHAGGGASLGSPMHVVLLDHASPEDCDGNGVADLVEILDGTSADCDANLVPDVCDPDCNGNGIPDVCDIEAGTSLDCDANSIPDECEPFQDCNVNGVHDPCDVAAGTSLDQNGNFVPDECEAPSALYVDDDAAPGGDGSSAMPFRTLGEAFAASLDGGEIVVEDGLYVGPSNRDLDFDGRSLTVHSAHGPDACIVDCQDAGRAFLVVGVADAEIRGFTITRGNGNDGRLWQGGAVYVEAPFQAVTRIVDCVITDSHADDAGGAVSTYEGLNGQVLLDRCVFIGNSSALGGAAAVNGSIVVRECAFIGNSGAQGGGLHALSNTDELVVGHSVFLGNQASSFGGAVAAGGTEVQIDDCLFAGNEAGSGGGVDLTTNLSSVLLAVTQSTIVGNQAVAGGGLRVSGRGAAALLEGNIVHGNTATVIGDQLYVRATSGIDPLEVAVGHSLVEGGQGDVGMEPNSVLTWLAGNVDADPLFVDPDGADDDPMTLEDNDYRLAAGSPAIDAGDNAAIPPDAADADGDDDVLEAVPLDLDFEPRRVDDPATADTGNGTAPVVDMGCYEHAP